MASRITGRKRSMGKIIGIDLGTTNSCMAVLEGGQPTVITNSDGDRTTPSVVAWKGGDRIVGKTALRQRVTNVNNTIYSAKRFIGRRYDELTELDKDGIAYDLRADAQGRPVAMVDTDGSGNPRGVLAEEVSAAVLAKLKADAEKFLGEPVTEAVITVPAYFNDSQRKATKDAGKIAGLDVKRIINEPTAAALAYGFGKQNEREKTVMVFDLGGGTLDISILDINISQDSNGESDGLISVIATDGDNHLGGDLWDTAFCEAIERRFKEETGSDLAADPQKHARVLEAAREAKHDLSNSESTNINLPFIDMGTNGAPLSLDYDYTRAEFEDITRELLDRCRKPIESAMEGARNGNCPGLTYDQIDEVLLVGGSTRMPAVQKLVADITGKTPEMTVNPDEVVAMGAAVQGGVLNNECQDIVLADVTSMALGIKSFRASDGKPVVSHMIPKNMQIPTEAKQSFTTRVDNQSSVEIVVVQGEDDDPDSPNNKVIGTAVLDGIPPMPKGTPSIEVTLEYDSENIINVSAIETTSGKHMTATINGSSTLDNNEVLALAAAEARS